MYAIYLNDIERFIAIEKDLWIAHASAKLLSSKLSISICDIGNALSVTNYNCFQWTLSSVDLPASTQYPKLVVPKDSKLEFVGDPINTDMEMLKLHQQFCLLVLKVVFAAKMTDIELNSGDRKYFQSLLKNDTLLSASDESGIPGGFLHTIERILYLSSNVTHVMSHIELMFNNSESIFPRNLAQYKLLFYKYLNA
jgi:hypothetical protein